MKKTIKGFVLGLIIATLLMSTVIGVEVKNTIEVAFNLVNLTVNGKKVDEDTILYEGTTYVPLRAVGEMLGKEVGWNQKTKTASVDDKKVDNNENDFHLNKITNHSSEDIKYTEIKGGIIKGDLLLSKDKSPYKIIEDIQLSDNANLIIREGVVIDGNNKSLEVFNTKLQIKGTRDDNIVITNLNIMPNYTDENNPPELDIEYVKFIGGTPCGNRAKLTLKNSILKNTKTIDLGWAQGKTNIEKNILINAGPIILAPYKGHSEAYIKNNIFEGGNINIKLHNFPEGKTFIQYNTFDTTGHGIYITNGSLDAKVDANDNYWGTVDTIKIDKMIFDKSDDLNSGIFVDYSRILKEPHMNTPKYE